MPAVDEGIKTELEDTSATKGHAGESEERSLADAAKITYLTAETCSFRKTEGQLLAVKVGEVEHPVVYLHCSFPHTNKRIYVSVRTSDNKEIGMIRSLDEFPAKTIKLLEEQIQIRYFAPEISKVVRIRDEFGYSYWEVETQAGYCRFTVRSGGGNVKLVTEVRVLVTDVDGNRFIIPELEALSEKEYRMVEMCM